MKLILAALAGLVFLVLTPSLSAQGELRSTPLDQLTPNERLERRVTPEVLVVRAASPTVVYIQTDTEERVRDWWGRVGIRSGRSSGSGVVLSSGGFVVTNYHVVKGAKLIRVSFEKSVDDTIYDADLVSFVAEEDLALLKIVNPQAREFETVPIGNSSDLMIGETVLAIGNPYGQTHTVSRGIISGLHRDIKIQSPGARGTLNFDDLIQTDASINPGNSGGPLLNINGELIGINNAVNQAAENIGFAIPIDRVMSVLQEQLIAPDKYNAWLGFEISEDDSLRVEQVLPGSPAALAGLRIDDRVIGFGVQKSSSLEAYRLYRLGLHAGDWAELRVERAGRAINIPVQAWEKADGVIYGRLGVLMQRVIVGREARLAVRSLLPDGPAEKIELKVGDELVAIRAEVRGLGRNYRIQDRISLAAFLDRFPPGAELGVEVLRRGVRYQGTVELD